MIQAVYNHGRMCWVIGPRIQSKEHSESEEITSKLEEADIPAQGTNIHFQTLTMHPMQREQQPLSQEIYARFLVLGEEVLPERMTKHIPDARYYGILPPGDVFIQYGIIARLEPSRNYRPRQTLKEARKHWEELGIFL